MASDGITWEVIAAAVFWVSAGIIGYVYVAYPLIVHVLSCLLGRPVRRGNDVRKAATVVITAYNEEKHIAAKIRNVLALDYPQALLEVVVVSDASSDRTDDLVRQFASSGVKLLRVEGRVGKTACQNFAVARALGEIVVFTDATTNIRPDALALLVDNFVDEDVGCVAGFLVYRGKSRDLTSRGGASYWNFEVALRGAESRLGTLIGVSGCLYAVRRSAYRAIAPTLISDFVIAMRMREQGLRTVLDQRAVCVEETLDRFQEELSMRVRVALRTMHALLAERRFLNPFVDPVYAWQLWSHKLLRYASPYFILLILVSCVVLIEHPFYRVTLFAHFAVMTAGFAGFLLHENELRIGLLRMPYYFVLTNLASLLATLRLFRGERIVIWNPIR